MYARTPISSGDALLATLSGSARGMPRGWTRAVRRKDWAPNNNSRVGSDHFTPFSYDVSVSLRESFGLARAGQLRICTSTATDRAWSSRKKEKDGGEQRQVAVKHPQQMQPRQLPVRQLILTISHCIPRNSLQSSNPDNGDLFMSNPTAMDESFSLDDDTDCSSLHESTQVLRLLSLIGVQTLQKSMFFDFQRLYLWPAVQEVWKSEQDLMIEAAQGEKLCLAGDGRADSPGHSADFGTYTLMDVTRNRVFNIELVKSTEVSSSNQMEKEGLVRAFTSLQKLGVEVGTIVTDRHREVNAYLRINHPDVQHRFDAWHFAKGIKKKIDAVSRTKAHEVLRKWKSTIIRHLYWCARTSNGDGDLVLAKWKSIMRHVIDVHIHQDPLHPACTETFRRLESVLMPAHLLRDIPRISPKEQTYALESFHGILVHFAPKSSKFKYEGMLAR
ncbi:hypothetical protein HPB47_022249 [Ixodes persulcatus]|uniref:Uncharacterized protein n=1 Tax=Ixodes persulcatus TaxID=34615 RepID=A0AC60QAY3_IXOPE|nr:hypothetical protein HPB47_022249 [Ixodes persulcatus]